MVLLLPGDVLCHLLNSGMRNRESAVAAAPGKLTSHQVALRDDYQRPVQLASGQTVETVPCHEARPTPR